MIPTYSPEELAQEWKVSTMTIYKLLSKGVLPHFRVGRHYRIPADYLDAYMRQTGNLDRFAPVSSHPRIEIPKAADVFVKLVQKESDAARKNIISITLFGSCARGTETDESDIDVLIMVRKLDRRVQAWVADLSDRAMAAGDYSEFLSVMRMSEAHWEEHQKMNTSLYKSIVQEGITLWPK